MNKRMHDLQIPFHGLKRFYNSNKKVILKEIDDAFCDGQFLKGPDVENFEKKLSAYCDRKHVITVSSGTDALFLALKSLEIKIGDEVIVSAYSFIASATAILRTGATPLFVDIHPESFLMDLKKAETAITQNTKAIIAVQLFGQTSNAIQLEAISRKYSIPVIEDAAQSLGSSFGEKKSGSIGKISCISFDPTKIIGAFGTGGAILTDCEKLYTKSKVSANNGKSENGYIESGYNSQINTAQANLLSWQLDFINKIIQQRQQIASQYNQKLNNIPNIQTPNVNPGSRHIFHKYVILSENRDELKDYLNKNGIETLIHYKNALFEHPVFNKRNCIIHSGDNTLKIKEKILSLPIYPDLSSEEIDYICDKIYSFYKKQL